jgi:hypothetical protein
MSRPGVAQVPYAQSIEKTEIICRGTELRGFEELYEFRVPGFGCQIDQGEGYREMESPGSGASWIQIAHAPALGLFRLMSVAADDEIEFRCIGAQVQLAEIMQNIEAGTASLHLRCKGQLPGPGASVDIATNGEYRRNEFQPGQDFRIAHVTGVHNQVHAAEGALRLRAQKAMRIRDNSDSH